MDKNLKESWKITIRHLAASRFYLQENLPNATSAKAEAELYEYLHANELGLALGSAEALGISCKAPPEFWNELQLAAENMKLFDDANRFIALAENQREIHSE